MNFTTSSINQHLPVFENKIGKNIPLKARIIFKDLNVIFGKFDSDIIVEYSASYAVWELKTEKMLILDEIPMITSMNMKMEDDIVYFDVLKHMIVTDSKYGGIKNAPTMNGMNLTTVEYREFVSSVSFLQNFLKKWMNAVYLKNGLVMPYNPKELYTSVAFKEQSMHILLEVED